MTVFGRARWARAVLYAVIRIQGGRRVAPCPPCADVRGRGLLLGSRWRSPRRSCSSRSAELEVPSGLTAVLIASAPLWVAIFAPAIDHSETVQRQAVGLFVGIAGVALLVGVESISTCGEFLGALGILGAAGCYALSSFMVKGAYRGMPATTSCISVGTGALLTAPWRGHRAPHEVPGTGRGSRWGSSAWARRSPS